jgi:hypothetical protein
VQHSSPVPPFLPQDGAIGRGTRGERRYRCSVGALSVSLSCSDLEHRAGFPGLWCGASIGTYVVPWPLQVRAATSLTTLSSQSLTQCICTLSRK